MALSKKKIFRKFHCKHRSQNMCWTAMVSKRSHEEENYGMEREANIEVFTYHREIQFTYIGDSSFMDRSNIKFYEIEFIDGSGAVPVVLKLVNQEEIKITFGSPGGKSTFTEAITVVSSSDSRMSEFD